ncbi:MAG TPA: cation:proton antiporter [Actinomycetes bacterium]
MDVGTVLLHVLVVLVAAKVGAELSERLGQPAVLGELVVGVLIGPSVLGLVGGDQVLAVLGELGVLLLLLQVGLETELTELLRVGRSALSVAAVGVALPFALGYLGLRLTGLAGHGHHVELFMGAALTATSVGVTARVFGDLGALSRAEARTVLGAAVADDVIGLMILAVMVRLVAGGSVDLPGMLPVVGAAVGFLVVGVVVGVRLAPLLFAWIERLARSDGTLIALALAFTLAFARLAELVRLAPIVGAFVAGVVLARSRASTTIGASLAPIAHVFVPVFFLQIGIDAEPAALLRPRALALAGLLLAAAVVGKVLAGLVAGRGMDLALVGFGMLPRGEVGLVFASIGLRLGVIDRDAFSTLLLVVVATTFVTPPLLRWRLARHPRAAPSSLDPSGPPGELVVRGGVLDLSGEPSPGTRALLGLRAARLASGARPGPRLLAWLSEGGSEPVAWSPPLLAELQALLRWGGDASWAFLEGTGLLSRYLPEVARARLGRPDRRGDAPWHQVTALARLAAPGHDAAAASVWLALQRPDNLLLAGLIRAVARSGSARAGVALARRTAARLGLGARDEEAVAALVGEEGDLAEAAVHLDSHDEEQVLNLAARLGSAEQARAAYLLALAERGEQGEWEGWRRGLLDELLRVVLAALAEPGLTDRKAENLLRRRRAEAERAANGQPPHDARAWLASAPRRYLLAQPPEVIAGHLAMADPPPDRHELRVALVGEGAGAWRVDVVARDRPGLLARLAGALAASGMDVARAHASTWPDGLVVDVFHVTGTAPPEQVEDALRRSVAGERLAPSRRGAAAGPVLVRVDADASPWHSVVQVRAPDRPGLLYELLLELARQHVDVRLARVGGDGGQADDLFHVTDAAGNLLDRSAADRLGSALASQLLGT